MSGRVRHGAPEAEDFWSRRRAGVAAEAEAERKADEIEAQARTRAEIEAEAAEKTDAEILTDLGLRDPDEMQAGDDFKAFLQEAVPARLRKRALRALWRSNPVLANVDMLVDYGEDFTDSATVLETLNTTYQVGKGMLRHVEILAEKAEAEAASEAEDVPAPPAPEIALVAEEAPAAPSVAPEPNKGPDKMSYDDSRIGSEPPEAEGRVYRRMRFDFPAGDGREDGEKGEV